MYSKIVMVRNGKREWKIKKIFKGWSDKGIKEKGNEEEKEEGKRIKEEGMKLEIE